MAEKRNRDDVPAAKKQKKDPLGWKDALSPEAQANWMLAVKPSTSSFSQCYVDLIVKGGKPRSGNLDFRGSPTWTTPPRTVTFAHLHGMGPGSNQRVQTEIQKRKYSLNCRTGMPEDYEGCEEIKKEQAEFYKFLLEGTRKIASMAMREKLMLYDNPDSDERTLSSWGTTVQACWEVAINDYIKNNQIAVEYVKGDKKGNRKREMEAIQGFAKTQDLSVSSYKDIPELAECALDEVFENEKVSIWTSEKNEKGAKENVGTYNGELQSTSKRQVMWPRRDPSTKKAITTTPLPKFVDRSIVTADPERNQTRYYSQFDKWVEDSGYNRTTFKICDVSGEDRTKDVKWFKPVVTQNDVVITKEKWTVGLRKNGFLDIGLNLDYNVVVLYKGVPGSDSTLEVDERYSKGAKPFKIKATDDDLPAETGKYDGMSPQELIALLSTQQKMLGELKRPAQRTIEAPPAGGEEKAQYQTEFEEKNALLDAMASGAGQTQADDGWEGEEDDEEDDLLQDLSVQVS